jgi:hypothetical protein
MKTGYTDRGYYSFTAAVAGALEGKEGYLVELVPGTRTIQLYTATAGRSALGTLFQHLEGDDNTWNVRLLGKGGTVRMVASGNIQQGLPVKGANGGTVIQAATGDKAMGVLVGPSAAQVANDIIEVADNFHVVI